MRAVAPRFGIRYTTVSWLARKVRSTYHRRAEETEEDILRDHINVSLLTIDEIGVGLGSDHEKAMVHDVIAGRYDAKKPTILLSNLSLEAVLEAIGDRLVDRLREDAGIVLPCAWPSYRGRA
jgi:DNA replication protein DnaC